MYMFFFFFQAEDGIRDWSVTGVQTCALPIYQRGFRRTVNFDGNPPAGTGDDTDIGAFERQTAPATITKAFSPTTIQSGGTTTVTLTLGNTNAFDLTNASFTDTLVNMSAAGGHVSGP